MSHIATGLYEEIDPILRRGEPARCERIVAEKLAAMPLSPFHIAVDLSITNTPAEIAAYFDGFFAMEAGRFQIGAAYTEMNGFDINPDRWYFEPFAYAAYGGSDEYEWLSDWQSQTYDEMTVTGLEKLQEVYANEVFRDKRFRDAGIVASLLVVTKFQDLIRRSAPLMRRLRFPLLATAHDFELIFEVRPEALNP